MKTLVTLIMLLLLLLRLPCFAFIFTHARARVRDAAVQQCRVIFGFSFTADDIKILTTYRCENATLIGGIKTLPLSHDFDLEACRAKWGFMSKSRSRKMHKCDFELATRIGGASVI